MLSLKYRKVSKEFIPPMKKLKTNTEVEKKPSLITYKRVSHNLKKNNISTHPILELGCRDVMKNPLFKEPADVHRDKYLGFEAGLWPLEDDDDDDNFCTELYGAEDTGNTFRGAFGNKNVQNIIRWIKLVSTYLNDIQLTPEPFQIEIFAHAVFFMASIKAYEHGEILYAILKRCFNVGDDDQIYKAKSCVFMVMRRQGKTEWTKIMFAAALLTLPDVRLAYYVHHVSLLDVAMSDIELKINYMRSKLSDKKLPIKSVSYSRGTSKLVVTFNNNKISSLEGRSTSNPDVSIFFFISLYPLLKQSKLFRPRRGVSQLWVESFSL